MRESKLTVSQAMKLYTGTGLAETILGLAAYDLIFYIGASVCMTLLVMFGEGISYPEAVRNISETPAGDCIMVFAPAIINVIILLSQYNKDKPGGKLFRTVKGGFDTFVSYRTGAYISMLLSIIIYGGVMLLFALFGLINTNLKESVRTHLSFCIIKSEGKTNKTKGSLISLDLSLRS